MVTRRPLVIVSGALSELPKNDVAEGTQVTLVPNPSGLYVNGSALGYDGSALVSGAAAQTAANTALASGNAALSSAATAQASGNAALSSVLFAQASGNAALLDLTYNYPTTITSTGIALNTRITVLATGVRITLPASPDTGDEVTVGTGSGISDTVVSGNGARIMQLNENLTIDVDDVNVTFVYVNPSLGWRVY